MFWISLDPTPLWGLLFYTITDFRKKTFYYPQVLVVHGIPLPLIFLRYKIYSRSCMTKKMIYLISADITAVRMLVHISIAYIDSPRSYIQRETVNFCVNFINCILYKILIIYIFY